MSLVRKAGYSGSFLDIINLIQVTRYQCSKYSLTFIEFAKIKAEVGIDVFDIIHSKGSQHSKKRRF